MIGLRCFSSTTKACSMIGRRILKCPPEALVRIDPFEATDQFPRSTRQFVVQGPKGTLSLPLEPFVVVDFPGVGPLGSIGGSGNTGITGSIGVSGVSGSSSEPSLDTTETLQSQDDTIDKLHVSISVQDPTQKQQRSVWGTTRSLISNIVIGVTEGFVVPIRLVGVGYRAQIEDATKTLTLRLGFANAIVLQVPQGIDILVPNPQRIILQGCNLQLITQFAAKIRSFRKPEPYNQKGIFVGDETIKKKSGKKR